MVIAFKVGGVLKTVDSQFGRTSTVKVESKLTTVFVRAFVIEAL